MKKQVILIGATGTIGQAITTELASDYDVISVGGNSGDHQVDIASTDSIIKLYQQFPKADAVICAAARGVVFKPIAEMDKQTYLASLQAKQLGQVDLVLQGLKYLGEDVSYTLTTGLLNHDPIQTGTAASMVDGAIDGFVVAAAIDVPARQRINVVSPALIHEALDKYRDFFPGFNTVTAAEAALAYRKSAFSGQTGQIYRVGW